MGKKIDYQEVKEMLFRKGFKMLDENYYGIREKHTIIDKNGYMYSVRLDNLLNSGRLPERFRKTNPYTIFNLNHFLAMEGVATYAIPQQYINAHGLLTFICGLCGKEYVASLNHVVSRGQVLCQHCSKVQKGINHRVPFEKVVFEFEKSGLTPLFDCYNGCDDKLKCMDSKGNILFISYRSLAQRNKIGYSDYASPFSRYEMIVKQQLDKLNIIYTTQYSFADCRYRKSLKFDFALFSKKDDCCPILLIEVDGQQHFSPVDFQGNGTENAEMCFYNNQTRDRIKDKYCNDNGIPLIRIPFFDIENGNYAKIIKERTLLLQNAAE